MSLRIAILSSETFRYHSTNPLDLAEVLGRAGHRVEVFAPFHELSTHDGRAFGLQPLRIAAGGRRRNIGYWTKTLWRVLRTGHFDVFVGVNPPGFLAAHLARTVQRRRARLVYYALELNLPEDGGPWSASVAYQMRFARQADVVVATGPERAALMRTRLRLGALPYVLENSPIAGSVSAQSPLRRLVGGNGCHARFLAVYAGAMNQENAIQEMLEAATLWRSDTALVLLGATPLTSDLATRLDRSPARIVHLGAIQGGRYELLRHLAGADLGIALYKHRGAAANMVYRTPNKIFDYLACGLPAVCSNNPSLVFTEREGWAVVVDADQPPAIAGAVDRVIDNLETMKAVARRRFDEQHNYTKCSEALVARISGWR